MFQKILLFSIHLYPGNLSKVTVLANACSGMAPFSHLVLPRYFACCLLAERDAFALLVEKYWELISRKSDMAS